MDAAAVSIIGNGHFTIIKKEYRVPFRPLLDDEVTGCMRVDLRHVDEPVDRGILES